MRLSKEELEAIEKDFARQFERNPEKMIAQYRATFGNYLCNDNALELCSAYKDASNEQKRMIAGSSSIRQTAGGVVYGTLDQMLKESPPAGAENIVTFVAGGAGSGKTHFIKEHSTVSEIIKQTSHIVFEVVLSFEEMNIERTLNAGKDALMLYIHRPIEAAALGALKRAEDIGRIPTFDYLCDGHFASQQRMQRFTQMYKEHNGVIVAVGDNTGKEPRIIEPGTAQTLEFLKINAYKDSREVRDRAFKAIQDGIKQREKEGRPIDQKLIQYYVGREQAEREQTAEQTRRQKDQDQERTR